MNDLRFDEHQRALFNANIKIVHWTVRQMYHDRSGLAGIDRDDLFQAGMIGLAKAVKTFTGDGKFSTLAFTIVRRSMLDEHELNRKARRIAHADCNRSCLVGRLPRFRWNSYDESPTTVLENRDETDRLNQAIRRLAQQCPRLHGVLQMRMNGSTLEKIATTLSVSRERVRQMETRCKAILLGVLRGEVLWESVKDASEPRGKHLATFNKSESLVQIAA